MTTTRKILSLSKKLPSIITAAFLLAVLVPPVTTVRAADMDFEDTVMHKIIEFCDGNDDYDNESVCILRHWGGEGNQLVVNQKCSAEEEPDRCTHEELIGLQINAKFRSNPGGNNGGNNSGNNSGENDNCDVRPPLRVPPECIGNVPGSYPNTTCYTGNGGAMQKKLCPRNAVYPNGDPPAQNKCYASTTTESTGGRDVYEESSCDESTFTIAPPGQEPPNAEENEESCTQRFKFSAGWIVCSVLELVSDGIDGIFGIADSMLNVDAQNLYENDELRGVWSYFRIIATFALVIIGLVMVISQGIGGKL